MRISKYLTKAFSSAISIPLLSSSIHAQGEQSETSPVEPEIPPIVAPTPPNVIVIITDDQGWGDFGIHGNKVFDTPHLDNLAKGSASWESFYVSPVCSPTRASLMTGRYNQRTKCLDTYLGRSMMASDEVTVAEALKGAGYTTGIFGKWHLGDNFPMRPSDQGFEYSLIHRGGGLAQPSEPQANNRRYTDPILFRNNREVETKGYCTDIYFEEAISFIKKSKENQRPFFAYIATNAPHGPFHDVPKDLLEKYQAKDISSILPPNNKDNATLKDKIHRVGAMATNIDDNVGKLIAALKKEKSLENTLEHPLKQHCGHDQMKTLSPYRRSLTNGLNSISTSLKALLAHTVSWVKSLNSKTPMRTSKIPAGLYVAKLTKVKHSDGTCSTTFGMQETQPT